MTQPRRRQILILREGKPPAIFDATLGDVEENEDGYSVSFKPDNALDFYRQMFP